MLVVEDEIIKLLRWLTGSKRAINRTTEIYLDVGLSGDDACEFLDTISKKYGTSFASFKFTRHFENEGQIFSHWGSFLGRRDRTKRTFTIGHLLAVIDRGFWFEPTEP